MVSAQGQQQCMQYSQHWPVALNVDIATWRCFQLTAKKYGTFEHAPILQMCSLCEVIGRGVHFNAYATVGGQVDTVL